MSGLSTSRRSGEYDSYAYLSVTCDAPLAEVQGWFGLPGEANSFGIGMPRKRLGAYKFTRWNLASGLPQGRYLDDHLRALWPKLLPLEEKLCNCPGGWKRYLVCVASFAAPDTPITLAGGNFKLMARYRLDLDFDAYFDADAEVINTWSEGQK